MKQTPKWGMSVETTPLAIKKNIFSQHRRGICLGMTYGRFNKHLLCMVVVCNGQVTPQSYHPSFWKKA